ncbi:MAG TPA: ABC transporter substrate-binding protein [Tessaracoccus flavescens]|uniref:ABC transporter substrate-binding protein n=1 Tax=Tessaracoccus flavescens TaxID=399497 RepID=A0A921EMC5_9ACTN|nr:ABC transporter substrate-binding protein [Tessaracoccus flavescens]
MRRLFTAGLLAAVALTACGSDATTPAGTSSTAADSTDRSYDVSGIQKVDDIAALLPQDIQDKGKIVIGASTDYAPAEFRADDLTTAIGYDVDLGKALGKVLGVETEVSDAEFASLLPGIGTKYDIGISSFTINEERTANYNMISYLTAGSSYAVKSGNPEGFDPDDVCGQAIAVQTGTYQDEELAGFSQACVDAGKPEIEVLQYGRQSDATTNVVGGKAVAFYADSPIASYSAALTGGQLEVVGGIRDAAPQGIVVAQDNAELTEAMQKAMQHLMDDGTWGKILDQWGVEDAALSTADVNPQG